MLFRAILDIIALGKAKLHSASPHEITSPFPHAIYPIYTQKHVITYTNIKNQVFELVVVVCP